MRPALAAAGIVIAFSAGVTGLGALGTHVQQAPTIAGDQLGMEAGESWEHYRQRAEESLDRAPGDEKAYALVTFEPETGFAAASRAVEPARRVGAVVFPGLAPRAIPEPVGGAQRESVFFTEAARVSQAAESVGVEYHGEIVSGVVVYDTGDVVRALSERQSVAAVEVLEPDAVWGAFGVSPASPHTR
ncbi:hypothetical protein [Corynebacterium sp. LK2510]|uniref:hypothetical protein n=1 Tax=Corynebacterium sp. LK2510 TaxID=3110472 RepID=UPI0034CE3A2E